jgi:hypothetical protein
MVQQLVERVVMSSLRRGTEERYQLDNEEAPRIARALSKAIEGANAVAEVRRLLELVEALRTRLRSPSAANALEAIVRSNPAAVRLVGIHILKTGAVDETRTFKKKEGRRDPLLAARIDVPAPTNTIKLAEFLDPASTGRVRQLRTQRRAT